MPLLDPKGPIGRDERLVILVAVALMLIVVIPVIGMVLWFPRKYRASAERTDYAPEWHHSVGIEWTIWLVPAVIVTLLGIVLWWFTLNLDPYKPIRSNAEPIRIEVVSMDWKWLFIYPDQQIAVVNQLVFPVQVPLDLRLTSSTVMTSFFVPRLGSQIYAMAGMQTRLHLMASEPGVYDGQNQQFSGRGFAEMNFKARAVPEKEFENWIASVRQAPQILDMSQYQRLETPGRRHPVTFYAWVAPDLFDHILGRNHDTVKASPGESRIGS